MARGRLYRPEYVDKATGERKEQKVYWCDFSVNGRRYRESTGKRKEKEAERYLTRRLRELDVQGPDAHDFEDVELRDLMELIRQDYKEQGRKSNVEYALSHLEDHFGETFPVARLGDAQVRAYRSERKEEGAANATINRELSALRRMLNLGERSNLVAPGRAPDVSGHMLAENNVRTGFVNEAEFQKLKRNLPPHLRPLAEFAFVTGWRREELLSRDFEHVEDGEWLRLRPGETKSGEGRSFPLTADLRAVLDAQRERKRQVEREHPEGVKEAYDSGSGEVEALFFFYAPSDNGLPAGRRIKSFRRSWDTARKAIGKPDLLFHDLRRSACRRMIRAGLPQSLAQKYTGHETASIFQRYNIVSEADLREGADKLQAYQDRARPPVRESDDTNGAAR